MAVLYIVNCQTLVILNAGRINTKSSCFSHSFNFSHRFQKVWMVSQIRKRQTCILCVVLQRGMFWKPKKAHVLLSERSPTLSHVFFSTCSILILLESFFLQFIIEMKMSEKNSVVCIQLYFTRFSVKQCLAINCMCYGHTVYDKNCLFRYLLSPF